MCETSEMPNTTMGRLNELLDSIIELWDSEPSGIREEQFANDAYGECVSVCMTALRYALRSPSIGEGQETYTLECIRTVFKAIDPYIDDESN